MGKKVGYIDYFKVKITTTANVIIGELAFENKENSLCDINLDLPAYENNIKEEESKIIRDFLFLDDWETGKSILINKSAIVSIEELEFDER